MSPRSIEVKRERVPAATSDAPVAAGLEGRGYPGRSVGRVRWPASRYAGAEPGRAAGRRGTSLGKSGRYFVAPSLAIARRRRTLAAHCRISAVGVSDAPADRTDHRRLSPHNDLSPVRMLPAVKRLFIETQALIRRALHQDGSPVGGRRSATPRLSIAKRCCGSGRQDLVSRPVWTEPTGSSPMGSLWQQTGTPMGSWQQAGTNGFLGKGDVMIHGPYLAAGPVGSDW